MNTPSSLICLTPTRNEAWIMDRFLRAASGWADRIIIADQGSTDNTREIVRGKPKVDLVVNESPEYDEGKRTELLLACARKSEGRRILIALDADEALSANWMSGSDWKRIQAAAPGTVLRFKWVNILPGFKEAWIPASIACGFVDDGSARVPANRIHNPRVPFPEGSPVLDFDDIVVLHFHFVVWERMVSKSRWYQAWERVNNPEKSALEIFRKYHHMFGSWTPGEIHPLKPEWIDGHDRQGICFRSLACEPVTWWDKEVIQMLVQHGPDFFRKTAIWDKDWMDAARFAGMSAVNLADPRSVVEKFAHRLLLATQKYRSNPGVRVFEFLLRKTGW